MRAPRWLRRRLAVVEPVVVPVHPIGDLNHPDVVRRRAAEAAWLREARAHQAAVVAARAAVTDG